ncbi:hypothetical protein AC249_AIPGENE9404 [Exaiptasia diaphana]|nr:hypothetical protein AC249_AIPGENE9404 [Exaiptasia diaphana]
MEKRHFTDSCYDEPSAKRIYQERNDSKYTDSFDSKSFITELLSDSIASNKEEHREETLTGYGDQLAFNENFDLFADPKFHEKLQYRFRRKKLDDLAIEDVYDGEIYRQLSNDGGFLSCSFNLSLIGNSDGVAVVKSSGASVWPVYFAINELSPKERFSRKNRLLAGLWFGKGKPYFPTFMRPFTLSLQELYFEGIQVNVPNKKLQTYRVTVLDMSLDAPAHCLWQSMKQFNGYFGCGKCKEPGEQLVIGIGQNGSKRQCHIHPYNKNNVMGHAPSRTHEEMKQHAKEALSNIGQGKSKNITWSLGDTNVIFLC